MENDALVFRYVLRGRVPYPPICHISVYEKSENNVECIVQDAHSKNSVSNVNSLSVDQSVVDEIRQILCRLDVTDLESLQHVAVMDGFTSEFSYFNGSSLIEITGYNIGWCVERPELYPNVMAVLDALDRIADLLVPVGADEKCFSLGEYERSDR